MGIATFKKGDQLMVEGERGDTFFILRKGAPRHRVAGQYPSLCSMAPKKPCGARDPRALHSA